jgi:hypothetical protein
VQSTCGSSKKNVNNTMVHVKEQGTVLSIITLCDDRRGHPVSVARIKSCRLRLGAFTTNHIVPSIRARIDACRSSPNITEKYLKMKEIVYFIGNRILIDGSRPTIPFQTHNYKEKTNSPLLMHSYSA